MNNEVMDQILAFLGEAKKLPSYEPSEEVDRFFSQLCVYARSDFEFFRERLDRNFDFSISSVVELQNICSLAEEKMEKFWAQKIIDSKNPRKTLSEFTYYMNYQKLTNLEYHLLLSQLSSLQKVLFVGSGALPLTAILLAKQGIKATLVERDNEAYDLSSQLIKVL